MLLPVYVNESMQLQRPIRPEGIEVIVHVPPSVKYRPSPVPGQPTSTREAPLLPIHLPSNLTFYVQPTGIRLRKRHS